ncbi:hypothetical protein KFZ70_12045 [Tamlana fucoidanivorans]|uniref:Uncharacterized protein n=1 Tax=Allotamlana fucoidanivorans TaxID=2583814 RepID=A0A5C4SMK9_9FLAO|nr:hypothetical protein [Tamlana fucoidanivorans]TNJ44988.1 hypothetical protein FGF67_07475 [Tamlana fucoidanivorans]
MRKISALIFIFLITSCQRNDLPDENSDSSKDRAILFYTEKLNEYVLVNGIFQDVVNNVGDAILKAESELKGEQIGSENGPELIIEPFDLETFPKTITVDFGRGTLCEDGIVRRGIITIISSGWFGQLGSFHTTTFNNFYHDIFKVQGTQVVENWGENEDGDVVFGVTVENGNVTSNNGINITFDEESNRTWIAGSETASNIWDDEYLLEGIQWGITSDGTRYLVAFEPPLHYVLKPRTTKSGVVDLAIDEITGFKINYTNQTITVLGETTSWN